MKIAAREDGHYDIGLTWHEVYLLSHAMAATLGGDLLYTEYETRVGAKPTEVVAMIYQLQDAYRKRPRKDRPPRANPAA